MSVYGVYEVVWANHQTDCMLISLLLYSTMKFLNRTRCTLFCDQSFLCLLKSTSVHFAAHMFSFIFSQFNCIFKLLAHLPASIQCLSFYYKHYKTIFSTKFNSCQHSIWAYKTVSTMWWDKNKLVSFSGSVCCEKFSIYR